MVDPSPKRRERHRQPARGTDSLPRPLLFLPLSSSSLATLRPAPVVDPSRFLLASSHWSRQETSSASESEALSHHLPAANAPGRAKRSRHRHIGLSPRPFPNNLPTPATVCLRQRSSIYSLHPPTSHDRHPLATSHHIVLLAGACHFYCCLQQALSLHLTSLLPLHITALPTRYNTLPQLSKLPCRQVNHVSSCASWTLLDVLDTVLPNWLVGFSSSQVRHTTCPPLAWSSLLSTQASHNPLLPVPLSIKRPRNRGLDYP